MKTPLGLIALASFLVLSLTGTVALDESRPSLAAVAYVYAVNCAWAMAHVRTNDVRPAFAAFWVSSSFVIVPVGVAYGDPVLGASFPWCAMGLAIAAAEASGKSVVEKVSVRG